jgi:hypothetical protein
MYGIPCSWSNHYSKVLGFVVDASLNMVIPWQHEHHKPVDTSTPIHFIKIFVMAHKLHVNISYEGMHEIYHIQ